jgi:hypothetical protein
MTELYHDDRSGFEAQLETVTRSPVRELMEEDELKFLNRDQQILLIVDERGRSGAPSVAEAHGKLIRYVRRAGGLGREEFRDLYEREVASTITRAVPGVIEHRRSYPLFDHPMSYVGNWHIQGKPDSSKFPLDLIEEVWLSESADLALARNSLDGQRVLVCPEQTQTLLLEEYRSDMGRRMAPVANYRHVSDGVS